MTLALSWRGFSDSLKAMGSSMFPFVPNDTCSSSGFSNVVMDVLEMTQSQVQVLSVFSARARRRVKKADD
jgi:hypothetical protein